MKGAKALSGLLSYRAGPRALERLRRDGLTPGQIRAVVGPASGPRWLALVGLDQALLSTRLLTQGPIQLAGASAGAWRMTSFASRDPEAAHQRLAEGYIGQIFPRGVKAPDVSSAYRRMLGDVIGDDTGHITSHPTYELAIHTARCRLGGHRVALMASLLGAGALNVATAQATGVFFERVLFATRPSALPSFDGRLVPLDPGNLLDAAQASGTVPIYLEAVRNPKSAPRGAYVDGGLTDYHLRSSYAGDTEGLVLMFHYRRRILPRWLDRFRTRQPTPDAVADLLQIYPSADFVASLPDGQIPDRHDFKRFMDDPQERIRRWRQVVSASEALGEEFLADLDSGRLIDRVQPL